MPLYGLDSDGVKILKLRFSHHRVQTYSEIHTSPFTMSRLPDFPGDKVGKNIELGTQYSRAVGCWNIWTLTSTPLSVNGITIPLLYY